MTEINIEEDQKRVNQIKDAFRKVVLDLLAADPAQGFSWAVQELYGLSMSDEDQPAKPTQAA